MRRTAFVMVAVCGLTAVGLPYPGHAASTSSNFGAMDPLELSERTITITESTRYVNVIKFETIKFVVRGAGSPEWSFVWRFETFGTPNFPFSEIAPRPVSGKYPIRVYVAEQPMDIN